MRARLATLLSPVVIGSVAFRLACFVVMLMMTLSVESRPAPTLPDFLLAYVPYVPWVERYNYIVWVAAYVPLVAVLLWRDAARFVRYMVSAGLLALLRGVCILVTGLGPVNGYDLNAGMSDERRWQAAYDILLLRGVFTDNTPGLYLTKDLFFSGHVATTFLLLLYVWRYPGLRPVVLLAHLAVLASVVFGHLHYTIDILGAYAFTVALYAMREGMSPLGTARGQPQ